LRWNVGAQVTNLLRRLVLPVTIQDWSLTSYSTGF
jgi:hypothetical protein